MAEVTQRAEQQRESQKTLLGTIVSTPFQFLGVMFGSLIGAIIVEWVCLYFFWPDAGWKHAQAMFEYELSWLSQGLLHSVVVQEPGRTATWLAQLAYDWLFVKTGMVDWMTNITTIAQAGPRSPLDVHQHQSPAHPVALRRAARRSGVHHSIHLQEIPLVLEETLMALPLKYLLPSRDTALHASWITLIVLVLLLSRTMSLPRLLIRIVGCWLRTTSTSSR